MNAIARLLSPVDIQLDVDVADKRALFERVGRHMAELHGLDPGDVTSSLIRREKAGSTGLGHRVAIPHARVHGLDRIRICYLRLGRPIPFGAPDRQPVSDVLVLLVPNPAAEEHLRLLADATQLFSSDAFRSRLHQCHSTGEVKRQFDDWATALS